MPVVINSRPYILDSKQEFMIAKGNNHYFFESDMLDSHCFWSNNQRFCFKPSGNWSCEIDHLNNIYTNDKCMKRLNKANIVTQIARDTYFTIFDALVVKLVCPNGNFSVYVENNFKITNNWICIIKTQFFEFNPNNRTQGIFIAKNVISVEEISIEEHTKTLSFTNIIFYAALATETLISILAGYFYCKYLIERTKLRREIRIELESRFSPYIPSENASNYV